MASLNGVTGNSLVPPEMPKKAVAVVSAADAKSKTTTEIVEAPCVGCGSVLTGKALAWSHDWSDPRGGWIQDEDETLCKQCANVLPTACGRGLGSTGNCADTLKKLERIREDGMLVMLSSVSLGHEGGGHVRLDFGDVFKVSRVSADLNTGKPDFKRSMARLIVDVNVGPVKVTLWPREVASMNLLTVLALQRDGDYEMAYVSTEDREGYFTLTPKAKAVVIATFGDR